MTDTTRKSKRKPGENRGGARPGAGRPKGARDQVSIQSLLEALNDQTGGLD